MSENIFWRWIKNTGLAVLQFGSTVIELLRAWRQRWSRRDDVNDFDRILKGETRRGWRQVFRKYYYPLRIGNCFFSVVSPCMKNSKDQRDTTTPLGTTVTVVFRQPLLDGRMLLSIVRRSLIRDAEMSIAKLAFHPLRWNMNFRCFLNIRTIAIGFKALDADGSPFRLVLVDTERRSTRKFLITCPPIAQYASFAYVDTTRNGRLHVVFGGWERPEDDDDRFEYFDAAYDLPLCEENTERTFEPRSWESISFLVGNRYQRLRADSVDGLTVLFYNTDSLAAGNDRDHLCVSFDTKAWRVQTLADWRESFRNSPFGPQILEAAREFSLLAIQDPPKLPMPAEHLFWSILPYQIGGAVLAPVTSNGFFQRLILPPSLKRRAAEAFFKATPKLGEFKWKEEVGFEVLDGISEDVNSDDGDVIINV